MGDVCLWKKKKRTPCRWVPHRNSAFPLEIVVSSRCLWKAETAVIRSLIAEPCGQSASVILQGQNGIRMIRVKSAPGLSHLRHYGCHAPWEENVINRTVTERWKQIPSKRICTAACSTLSWLDNRREIVRIIRTVASFQMWWHKSTFLLWIIDVSNVSRFARFMQLVYSPQFQIRSLAIYSESCIFW
jgi:hypothetical protein